ncbi:MAG: DNA-binding domain-containing protein [Candidatus Sulfotelmatobacter sp.]
MRKKVGAGIVLSLRELQLAFCRTVVGPPSSELLSLIDGDVFSPDERLSIYRNNVLSRLSETLKEAFPVVRRIVGREFFDYATHSFIEEHLPSEPCLSAYGTRFPQFLKSFPAASQLSYLPDVAQLEWSISQVVRAAPEKWVPITGLGGLSGDPAAVRLRLTPRVRYLTSAFRIDQIWMAHQQESDDLNHWHIDSGAAYFAVHAGESLALNVISKATWTFRSYLADGQTLGSATSMALDVDRDFDIPSALVSLFGEHLVTAIGDRN